MRIRTATIVVYRESVGDSGSREYHTFKYPETKMEFKVSQIDTAKPDSCMFKIYGVSRETYSVIKNPDVSNYSKKQYVKIFYGRDGDEDLVYTGTVSRVVYSFDNGNQTMTCLLTQDGVKYENEIKSISTAGETNCGIAMSLISEAFGYKVKYGSDANRSIILGKISVTGNLDKVLRDVLSNKFSYYVKDKVIRIYSLDKKITRKVILTLDTGLLNYPTEDSKGEKIVIKSVLLPLLEAGMVIKIPLDKYWYSLKNTGTYASFVVGRYTTSFSGGVGISTMECEKVE